MTPAERLQAVAMLSQAEAMKHQAVALLHVAEAQIHAANALLVSEAPASSAELAAAAEQIFGEPQKSRHYGSRPNPPGLEAVGGVRAAGPE